MACLLSAAFRKLRPRSKSVPRHMALHCGSLTRNVLLEPWTGPHRGVPPFGDALPQHLEPALERAMLQCRQEIDSIASDKSDPTFENTVEVLQDTGRTLNSVEAVFGVFVTTRNDSQVRYVNATLPSLNFTQIEALVQKAAPKLAGLRDSIYQNEKLFARISAVHSDQHCAESLSSEQHRLLDRTFWNFRRAGAELGSPQKQRIALINQSLAALCTKVSQNILHDEQSHIELTADQLQGLPASLVQTLASAAEVRGLPSGTWIVVNTRSAVEPVLRHAQCPNVREAVWRAFASRGDNNDDHDNNGMITEILSLRSELADRLGYPTHAHWRLDDTMAGTPERAMKLLSDMWPAAVSTVEQEVSAMKTEGGVSSIEPWDYGYYSERVRVKEFDLDERALEPYLQLDTLREGMMWTSTQLFGLNWEERFDVPVIHPDVRVWEVTNRSGGPVALFYFDPFARPGKQSGAWMCNYRDQESFRESVTPLVSNNCNFLKSRPGDPVLLSWADASTLFHEFGHALHSILSQVAYPALSGTNVCSDFVEFPSQLFERWLSTPEVLQRFAVHKDTGEPFPTELLSKLAAARTFNQGFATVEYLSCAILDLEMHMQPRGSVVRPREFEQARLAHWGMPKEVCMRHRPQHFAHIFTHDAYSAAYWSYLWADTLTADAAEAFQEAGSLFDQDTADRLQRHVLSVGNTVDPAQAFKAFRGRDATVHALLRHRGFANQ